MSFMVRSLVSKLQNVGVGEKVRIAGFLELCCVAVTLKADNGAPMPCSWVGEQA